MVRARIVIAALVLAVPAQGQECFCLRHPSGAVLRGCDAYQAPNDQFPTAVCTDPESGKRSQQTLYSDSGWTRVAADADRCSPCRPAPRGAAKEVPRGDEPAGSK